MAKYQSRSSKPSSAVRGFYDPAIREVIAEGDLAKMKRVLVKAREALRQQGDLPAAITRLEQAIAKREKP